MNIQLHIHVCSNNPPCYVGRPMLLEVVLQLPKCGDAPQCDCLGIQRSDFPNATEASVK